MTYDKVRVFSNHIKNTDRTTRLRVYENKTQIVDKELSAIDSYIMIKGLLPAIGNAIHGGRRDGYWVPQHGYHA